MTDDLAELITELYNQSAHAREDNTIPDAFAQMQADLATQLEQFTDEQDTTS
jgi:hypothetical protein